MHTAPRTFQPRSTHARWPRVGLHLLLAAGLAGLPACSGDDGIVDEPPPGPRLERDVAPATSGNWYRPPVSVRWQWQLDGTINPDYSVDLYDVDLYETPDAILQRLREKNIRIVCYFSAGTYEPGRPDAESIPTTARGRTLADWPNERWLDVRDMRVFDVMVGRLEYAARRGCDAVEPDNVDGFTNDTGFSLSADDQLAYNRNMANRAHALGLGIGLKNDGDQVTDLVDYYDFELNEECNEYQECDQLTPFLVRGKPVLNAEYADNASAAQQRAPALCRVAIDAGLRTLILPYDLDDRFRVSCF